MNAPQDTTNRTFPSLGQRVDRHCASGFILSFRSSVVPHARTLMFIAFKACDELTRVILLTVRAVAPTSYRSFGSILIEIWGSCWNNPTKVDRGVVTRPGNTCSKTAKYTAVLTRTELIVVNGRARKYFLYSPKILPIDDDTTFVLSFEVYIR